MEKIKAKVEQVLHKDKDTTHTTHGTTTGTGTHTGTHSDPSGPHSSHAANKADPRVDSDIPGPTGNTAGASNTTGHGLTGNTTTSGVGHSTHGTTGLGSNTTSTHGTTGLGSNTSHSDPTGPHNSKLANKLDPRVDSDQPGAFGNTGGARTGTTGTTGHTGAGLSSGTTGAYGSDPTGPHDSRLANSADPRVDHDLDGSRTVGNTGAGYSGTTGGTGLTGGHTGVGHTGTHTGAGLSSGTTGVGHTGTHTGAGLSSGTTGYGSDPTGPHNSRLANSADPRVDHDLDGSRTVGNTGGTGLTGSHNTTGAGAGYSGTAGGTLPGPADNTAGPHNSNLMNKLDPRVDSDIDGSKTVGQDPTYR